jgi:hypothetical protein
VGNNPIVIRLSAGSMIPVLSVKGAISTLKNGHLKPIESNAYNNFIGELYLFMEIKQML